MTQLEIYLLVMNLGTLYTILVRVSPYTLSQIDFGPCWTWVKACVVIYFMVHGVFYLLPGILR